MVAVSCIFCAIVEGRAPAEVVYADAETLAFLDINPATEGHTLVVPRRHVRDIWEATADDLVAVARTAHLVAERLRVTFTPDGLNLLHSTGAAAFQTVFHLHVHVVPRYVGDRVHLPWQRVRATRETLHEVAERIRAARSEASPSVTGGT